MIRYSKDTNKIIFRVFVIIMAVAIAIFSIRVVTGSELTKASDGEILLSRSLYTPGNVYDRNGNMILHGEGSKIVWDMPEITSGLSPTMGEDIEKTCNSSYSILGNTPQVFGSGDNRLDLHSLLHPNEERKGENVTLTIDAGLQTYITKLIKSKGYKNAYVMISNYESGEILAAYGDVLTYSMHPGSTIKPVLAAAALEIDENADLITYNCKKDNHTFKYNGSKTKIYCYGKENHGKVNMSDALSCSCNGYFITLVNKLDKEQLLSKLKDFGFDAHKHYSQFSFYDGSFIGQSFSSEDMLYSPIGQGDCMTTVANLNFATNALLNEGEISEPKFYNEKSDEAVEKICSEDTAHKVIDMMLNVCKEGTGKKFALDGLACKTGTAETGIKGKYTVWTTGGLVQTEYPYSVTVALDKVDDNVHSYDAGKIVKDILKFMKENRNEINY